MLQTLEPYQERNLPPLSDEQKQRLIRQHFRRLGKLGVAIPRYLAAPATSPRPCRPKDTESKGAAQ